MSRLIQRAPVSPEHLPLPASYSCASDKASWLPEGRVFSNVQREKIISKFLKGSLLKRVFGSQQLRWESPNSQKEDPSPACPSTRKKAEAQPAPAELFAQHKEAPAPGAGGEEDNGGQDTWVFEVNKTSRGQKNSSNKMGRKNDEICGTNLLVSSVSQENLSPWNLDSEEPLADNENLPLGKDGPAGKTNKNHLETPAEQLVLQLTVSEHAHSRVQNSNQGVFQLWNSPVNKGSTLDSRNSSVEENVTDESDLSENEKMNDSLLSYFKKMDLNLKPETIDHVERSFPEEANGMSAYADFLPAPFNTLDLHKFALSKCENWKAVIDPPESSIERLIIRLLELERLQHMTIQKEKPRLQSTFYSSMFSMAERPASSKAIALKGRPPKFPDTLILQTSSVEKSRDKRKNSSGSGKSEQNVSKWNWSSAGKCKLNSRPLLRCSSTAKQCVAAHEDLKNSKSSILNPCQELPPKPTTAQAAQPLAKVVSAKCLPPRSPVPVSPIPLSFPENPKEESKVPKTKRKLHRKSILLNRPFYIQKQNCLSPSLIARGKCSPTDQK
nr:protein FAM217A isoform X6 [Peromyscus maniculatus bairdii]